MIADRKQWKYKDASIVTPL